MEMVEKSRQELVSVIHQQTERPSPTLSIQEVVNQDIVALLSVNGSILEIWLPVAAEVLLTQSVDLVLDVDVLLEGH